MVVLYVLDVAEFLPIVEAARKLPDCQITKSEKGYWKIVSPTEIVFFCVGSQPRVQMFSSVVVACSSTSRSFSASGPMAAVHETRAQIRVTPAGAQCDISTGTVM